LKKIDYVQNFYNLQKKDKDKYLHYLKIFNDEDTFEKNKKEN